MIRDGREKDVKTLIVPVFLIVMVRVHVMEVLHHHVVSTVQKTLWVEAVSCLVFMERKNHLTAVNVNVIRASQVKLAILNVQDMAHAQTTVACVKKGGEVISVNSQIVQEILIVLSMVCVYERQRMFYLNVSAIKVSADQIVASYSALETLPVTIEESVYYLKIVRCLIARVNIISLDKRAKNVRSGIQEKTAKTVFMDLLVGLSDAMSVVSMEMHLVSGKMIAYATMTTDLVSGEVKIVLNVRRVGANLNVRNVI